MPDITIGFGGVIAVTNTPQHYRFGLADKDEANPDRGTMINEGPDIVVIGWNKDPATVDFAPELDKNVLRVNDSIRVPKLCAFMSLVTPTTSKIQYVED